MTGTCGSPLWPWAAGAAATTRARAGAGRPGRKAKANSSVSATPKNFLERNSFERERGIKILLAETTKGLTTEVAARQGWPRRARRPRPETTGGTCEASRPERGEKTFLFASGLRGKSARPALQAQNGTNANEELDGDRENSSPA